MDAHPSFTLSLHAALPRLLGGLRDRGYHFTPVTPATHRVVNGRPENSFGRSLQDVFGWTRPFAAECLDPVLFELARDAGAIVPSADGEHWRAVLRVATMHGMIFMHSAFPTDAPDAVFFGPDTLRFTDAVLQHLAARVRPINRAADIGTGSGAAGIAIACRSPAASVVLTDINEAAVTAATINAVACGAGNVTAMRSDILAGVTGEFDLIVANPPYLVDPAGRTYRHGGGAFGGALSVRIAAEAVTRLAPGGSLVLYTGSAIVQGRDLLRDLLEQVIPATGFAANYREVDPDVFGEELRTVPYREADRIAAVVFIVERTA